jgi:hypothetical protein
MGLLTGEWLLFGFEAILDKKVICQRYGSGHESGEVLAREGHPRGVAHFPLPRRAALPVSGIVFLLFQIGKL